MEIRRIDTLEKFESMEPYWNRLLSASDSSHIHSTFEWLFTWWRYFGKEKSLFILVAVDDDEIIGIAPLQIERITKIYKNVMRLRRVSFLGTGFADSADFLISKKRENVLKEFYGYLSLNSSLWDEIELRQIPSNSPNFNLLKSDVFPVSKYTVSLDESIRSPFLIINSDFETYLKGLGKGWRRDITKKNNKLLREKPEIKFKVVDYIDDRLINQIYNLTLARFNKTGWKSMFLDVVKYTFLREIIPILDRKGYVKFFFMMNGEDLIAYQFAFQFNNVMYFWNTSYLPEFAEYSIGSVLHYNTLKYCFDNRYSEADFMVGDEDYKYHWTSTQISNFILRLEKRGIKNKINSIVPKFKNWAKSRISLF